MTFCLSVLGIYPQYRAVRWVLGSPPAGCSCPAQDRLYRVRLAARRLEGQPRDCQDSPHDRAGLRGSDAVLLSDHHPLHHCWSGGEQEVLGEIYRSLLPRFWLLSVLQTSLPAASLLLPHHSLLEPGEGKGWGPTDYWPACALHYDCLDLSVGKETCHTQIYFIQIRKNQSDDHLQVCIPKLHHVHGDQEFSS